MNKDSDPKDDISEDTTGNAMTLPKSNTDYGQRQYWDERFSNEDQYEWLVSYSDVAQQLAPFLSADKRILVVGCGNSSFSADLYDAGYRQICSLDYSRVVIEEMRKQNQEKHSEMEWVVMDMTDMSAFADESFHVVIDKAAMDALLSQEGDVWNPNQSVIHQSRSMCAHISRILKNGCHHLQISFAQPHFRKKYLLGWHPKEEGSSLQHDGDDTYSQEFQWSLQVETIARGDNEGCFHNFLYIMTKQRPDSTVM